MVALFCCIICGPDSANPSVVSTQAPKPIIHDKFCSISLPLIANHGRHMTRQIGSYLSLTLNALQDRKYSYAEKTYKEFEGYRVGDDPFDEPFEQYAFRSRWHEAFIGLYQAHFCSNKRNNLYFNPVDSDVPVVSTFAVALSSAIHGDSVGARLRCNEILKLDPNFSYALTLLGSFAAAEGDSNKARQFWLAAAENTDHPLPMDEIGVFQRVPIELLLHFRP